MNDFEAGYLRDMEDTGPDLEDVDPKTVRTWLNRRDGWECRGEISPTPFKDQDDVELVKYCQTLHGSFDLRRPANVARGVSNVEGVPYGDVEADLLDYARCGTEFSDVDLVNKETPTEDNNALDLLKRMNAQTTGIDAPRFGVVAAQPCNEAKWLCGVDHRHTYLDPLGSGETPEEAIRDAWDTVRGGGTDE